MLKLLILPLAILFLPSGFVLARFLYKRGNQLLESQQLQLEEKKIEIQSKRDEFFQKTFESFYQEDKDNVAKN